MASPEKRLHKERGFVWSRWALERQRNLPKHPRKPALGPSGDFRHQGRENPAQEFRSPRGRGSTGLRIPQ